MLRPVPLPELPAIGTIYLCSMPGRYKPLGKFIAAAEERSIRHVVCLVSDEEIAKKSPEYLSALRERRVPGELWHLPIPDYGIPEDAEELDRLLEKIRTCLVHGESVVIHCAGGHGRTGMVAILLLARMGVELDEAIRRVDSAGSGPDTEAQWQFLTAHANQARAGREAGRPRLDDP
jgi:protein-tyrosine phosphatase